MHKMSTGTGELSPAFGSSPLIYPPRHPQVEAQVGADSETTETGETPRVKSVLASQQVGHHPEDDMSSSDVRLTHVSAVRSGVLGS